MDEEFDESFDSSDIPDDIPDDIPEDILDDVPEDIPEDSYDDVPSDESEDILDDVPEDIPEDSYDDVPSDESEDIQDDIPEDIPEDSYDDVPSDESEDIQDDIPEDIPEDSYDDVPSDESEDIQDDIPEDIPEDAYDDVPSDESEDIPEAVSEENTFETEEIPDNDGEASRDDVSDSEEDTSEEDTFETEEVPDNDGEASGDDVSDSEEDASEEDAFETEEMSDNASEASEDDVSDSEEDASEEDTFETEEVPDNDGEASGDDVSDSEEDASEEDAFKTEEMSDNDGEASRDDVSDSEEDASEEDAFETEEMSDNASEALRDNVSDSEEASGEDIVAEGSVDANPQFGEGGGNQYFIRDFGEMTRDGRMQKIAEDEILNYDASDAKDALDSTKSSDGTFTISKDDRPISDEELKQLDDNTADYPYENDDYFHDDTSFSEKEIAQLDEETPDEQNLARTMNDINQQIEEDRQQPFSDQEDSGPDIMPDGFKNPRKLEEGEKYFQIRPLNAEHDSPYVTDEKTVNECRDEYGNINTEKLLEKLQINPGDNTKWKLSSYEYASGDKSNIERSTPAASLEEGTDSFGGDYQNSDIQDVNISDTKVSFENLAEYMNSHNYGPDDFVTYSQDPQWRELQQQAYPDYKLPPLTPENAFNQLSTYMNDHNYGPDDFTTYSQDLQWRELQRQAYPDYELPPLDKADNLGKWNEIPPDITSKENLDAVNPNFSSGKEWKVNCQRCVPTYEMRARGYDVTAEPCDDYDSYGHLAYHPYDVWENPEVINCNGSGLEDIENAMKNWGDGARAQICVAWDPGDDGHTFMAEQRNGKTYFVDPQSGSADVSRYFNRVATGQTTFCKTDNLQPSQRILNCCKGVKR